MLVLAQAKRIPIRGKIIQTHDSHMIGNSFNLSANTMVDFLPPFLIYEVSRTNESSSYKKEVLKYFILIYLQINNEVVMQRLNWLLVNVL